MATAKKIQGDISSLKIAIRVAKNDAIKSKLKKRLEMAENELASIKSGAKPRKVSTSKGTKSLLEKAKSLVKKNPKYSGYKGANVDLKKDAEEGALAVGRRVSKGIKGNQYASKKEAKGNVYYEYRVNRLDVKQPKGKQSYPKLEDGGYMAKGGKVKYLQSDGTSQTLVSDKSEATAMWIMDAEYYISSNPKKNANVVVEKIDKSLPDRVGRNYIVKVISKKMEDGGYMAKGGGVPNYDIIVVYPTYTNKYRYDTKIFELYAINDSDAREKAIQTFKRQYPELKVENVYTYKRRLANGGYMAKGGKIKDQYEGREPEDIWNNLSKPQRQHFIYDHASEIEEYRGKEYGELSSSEIIKAYNSDYSQLDKNIKNRFNNHVREGQYKYGGYMAKGGRIDEDEIWDAAHKLSDERKVFKGQELAFTYGARWMEKRLSNKMADGGIAEGYHQMPDGSIMANSAHMAKGGETHRVDDPNEDVEEKSEMEVVRGYSDDEPYEYANGGITLNPGEIVEATTGVKLKVLDFKPDFGGRALVQRIDEFGEGLKPAWMPLTKFKLPKLV